ncbi:MAG: hypothetical protein NTY19_41920 [Planctomycetota bacterium]|nr:hypothetical protein [Planctomycetota bacterium]
MQKRLLAGIDWGGGVLSRTVLVIGTGTGKGAGLVREAGTRRRLQDYGGREWPSSARVCLNAE